MDNESPGVSEERIDVVNFYRVHPRKGDSLKPSLRIAHRLRVLKVSLRQAMTVTTTPASYSSPGFTKDCATTKFETNSVHARIHRIEEGLLLANPGIFKDYDAADWQRVQRAGRRSFKNGLSCFATLGGLREKR